MIRASLALAAVLCTLRVHAQEKPTVQFINPATLSKPTGFTHAVAVTGGKTVYVSGQVAVADGKIVGPNDFTVQVKQAFENVKTALTSAGASFADVVKLTVFVTDATQLPKYRQVRDQYVSAASPPASSFVEVRALARPEAMVEIEAVAVTTR